MYVSLLQLFLFSVILCHSLGLLHHSDPGTPNLDAVLDNLNAKNNVHEHRITTNDLKSVILALQKDYTSTLNTLRSDFELSLRSQQNHIWHLEKKVTHQEKLITVLKSGESTSRQRPSEKSKQSQEYTTNDYVEALNTTRHSPIKTKEFQNENISKAFGHSKRGRQERLLIQEVPVSSSVIAFYAYMSKSLPANIVTSQHVLVFDVARTNIGNAYHSSTGVFIVPETGVYVFIWGFMNGNVAVHSTQLMINSDIWGVVRAHSGSNNWMQSTSAVVAHVSKGDDVFVKLAYDRVVYSEFNSRTLFAGWKLH